MHVPVLLNEIMEMLALKKDGIYVDATVGFGGHADAIVSRIGPYGKLIGIDRDGDAIKYAKEKLGNDRVYLRKGVFSELKKILLSMNIKEVDGVLFDLGVSMFQLRDPSRGFSFLSNEKLDMRMDASQELTAWDVVNMYSEKDIERILREYGEEPFFRRIARKIVSRRSISTIDTCAELASLVAGVYGRRGRIHPATRTFQALRIEVNKELEELKKGLASAAEVLKTGGRLCVISYHSLEDRIAKNFIRDNVREGFLRMLTKKPLIPGSDEIRQNPSSRSAKLRGCERI
ncbi:MAG: 16S rRNA (cytosine(1402)-N(4))-methyltransferase [Thermodesulfovibrio sp.]|nr:16S rRNA (cytosine(1402)-N(4))-methyltransferase [Thermodesulfovibrio sp.]